MNILVVTGSPRKDGNSDILADAFTEGALEAGNEVRRIAAGRANIAGCRACEYCFSHEGACCQQDDMQDFYPDLRWADIVVYAFPLYFYTYPAQIKAFMDRQFCQVGGNPFNIRKTALLLCFEDKNIERADGLIQSFRIAADYCKQEIVGEVIVNAVYEKGAINGNPALEEARALGASLN